MKYTFLGLVLAMFFGIFFGSDGEIDPSLFDYIFWGLIISGASLDLLAILRDSLCNHCKCFFCLTS